jgi:hypothetical protein
MAKEKHQEPTSSKGTLAAMAIGALLVTGLVVWALTRTVEPAPATTATNVTETAGAFAPSTAAPITETAPLSTGTPMASATNATTTPIDAPPLTATSNITPPLTPPAQPTGDRSAVKRISAEDLREKMKAGNVVVVDVRDAGSYQTSHIAGALHVPMASIQSNLDLIPKTKEVVTYCT